MIRFKKFKGDRCFLQIGKYEGRNKRSKSVFRVLNGVKLEDLAPAVEKMVNTLPVSEAQE